ncbi:MAG: hydrogenase maturation protease [Oligoflexia bacterium]|nr:hydrogenase maturation protease [Oligoflexia bacterium]
MGDDGVGIKVIECIHENNLLVIAGVQAIEIGGNLLNVLSYFRDDVESILFVDATRMGLAPGEYRVFSLSEVSIDTREFSNISTHEGDLLKVVALAQETGYHIPPVTIMGIEPFSMASKMELSPLLQAQLLHYAREATATIG